jgi:hypothetical protein
MANRSLPIKVKGIRAALAWSIETAKLGRQHNDANVVAIGGRMHTPEFCLEMVDAFIAEPFSGDERHIRRIGMVWKSRDQRFHLTYFLKYFISVTIWPLRSPLPSNFEIGRHSGRSITPP